MLSAQRDKLIIVIALVLVSLLAWVITVQQSHGMGLGLITMSMTMGQPFTPASAALYVALWGVMMVAMMFPALAPMAALFSTVSRQQPQERQPFAAAWIFVAGYAVLWTLTGSAAYAGDMAIQTLPEFFPVLNARGMTIGGATLIAAGLYQMTPLKDLCLSKCRSPLGFLLNHWQGGHWGAFRMGLHHGAYCLGCCWSLMAVLFVVGTMNLIWMAVLSVVIFLEKVLRHGPIVGKLVGLSLMALGLVLIVTPESLTGL